jgi:hypothetical protein
VQLRNTIRDLAKRMYILARFLNISFTTSHHCIVQRPRVGLRIEIAVTARCDFYFELQITTSHYGPNVKLMSLSLCHLVKLLVKPYW